jgi:hypothetical protein
VSGQVRFLPPALCLCLVPPVYSFPARGSESPWRLMESFALKDARRGLKKAHNKVRQARKRGCPMLVFVALCDLAKARAHNNPVHRRCHNDT